jgi:hypothetical protein
MNQIEWTKRCKALEIVIQKYLNMVPEKAITEEYLFYSAEIKKEENDFKEESDQEEKKEEFKEEIKEECPEPHQKKLKREH